MKKKSFVFGISIFISFFFLAAFFPTIGKDITWSLRNVNSVESVLAIKDVGFISAILTTVFLKYKFAKLVVIGLLGVSLLFLMKSAVNKKNSCLLLIGLFFLFLFDRAVINGVLVQTSGFVNYFLGTLCSLLFVNLLLKDSVQKMNVFVAFVFGLILANLELPFSFAIFGLTVVYLCGRENKKEFRSFVLFFGEIVGLVYAIFHRHLVYTGFIDNLFRSFMPTICEQNFIITLILSCFILAEAIKVFTYGHRLGATVAILGVGSYLFSSLLSGNCHLNYVTFVFFSIASFYILMNLGNSRAFKRKMTTFYLFKLIYIIMLCLFGNITPGSTFILFVLDIVVIIDFYDQLLPTDFLWQAWLGVSLVILGANIYIYHDASAKYLEMNFYIKNKLECSTEEIKIPSKYKIDVFTQYVPDNKDEMDEYIDYYDIDVYGSDPITHLSFRNDQK